MGYHQLPHTTKSINQTGKLIVRDRIKAAPRFRDASSPPLNLRLGQTVSRLCRNSKSVGIELLSSLFCSY